MAKMGFCHYLLKILVLFAIWGVLSQLPKFPAIHSISWVCLPPHEGITKDFFSREFFFHFCEGWGGRQFSMHGHLQSNLATYYLLGCAPACHPLFISVFSLYSVSMWWVIPFNIGQNAGFWSFSSIFAIFTGFEEAMHSHGPADRPAGI